MVTVRKMFWASCLDIVKLADIASIQQSWALLKNLKFQQL